MPAARRARGKSAPVPTTKAPRDQYFSRAVAKALDVLEVLQTSQVPLALNEIAKRIELSKTSTFRLLRTLETAGYITLKAWGQYQQYQLAPGIHSVAPRQSLTKLLRFGTPHLQRLTREFDETASLAALFENRSEVVAVIESPQVIRMSNVMGHILPPHASSLGKAITAFQPPERREKLLRSYGVYRFTPQTITDQTELNLEFDRVRQVRFATDREESVRDGVCFGVPVFGRAGEVAAAVSVSVPKSRLRDSGHEAAIVAAITEAAKALAEELLKA